MRKRPSAIVPRAVFGLAAVGVVPFCVTLANCGGAQQPQGVAATAFVPPPQQGNDGGGAVMLTVAESAYTVPTAKGVAATAFTTHPQPSVAMIAYTARTTAVDASRDAKKD